MTDTATLAEWRRLFEMADLFYRRAVWEWMGEEDYFCITDPETGMFGGCVIADGERGDLGLDVHIGPDSRLLLKEILGESWRNNLFDEDPKEYAFLKHTLSLSFEDRIELDKAELQIIKELGLRFRGSGKWPMFRYYQTGQLAKGLNASQVRFLTVAIEQFILVADQFRENDELYFEHDETEEGFGEKRLHRVPYQTGNGLEWRDEWLPWHDEGQYIEPYRYPDRLKLKQLKKLKKSKEVWEADFLFYEDLCYRSEEGRTCFFRLCLWVDQKTGTKQIAHLVPELDCRKYFVEQLLELLEKEQMRPQKIIFGSYKAQLAMADTAEKLGIPVGWSTMLDVLDEAIESIENQGGKFHEND